MEPKEFDPAAGLAAKDNMSPAAITLPSGLPSMHETLLLDQVDQPEATGKKFQKIDLNSEIETNQLTSLENSVVAGVASMTSTCPD